MAKSLHQTVSFSGGVVSPKLDARVDQQKYGTWSRLLNNMVPYKTGGMTRRVGTQFMGPPKYPTGLYAVRTMAFIYSPTTTFDLEFGHLYVRFWSNGQQVAVSSAPTWVSGTTYPPGSYATSVANSDIYYTAGGIVNSTTDPNADPTHWVRQTIYEVPSPYSGTYASNAAPQTADVFGLVPCQINDVVYLVHPDYAPYKLTQFGTTDWTLVQVDYLTPALLDQNATDTTIAPSGTQGNGITLSATAPAWVTSTYYSLANSVLEGGLIYDCIVAHASGTFATDLASGYWQQVSIFNSQQIGGTWQLADLRNSAYLELDGTAANGFATGTDSTGGSWSSLPYTSGTIQCLGGYEVHTYGVWAADVAVQRSLDGGQTWDTVQTVTGRSDRNVDLTGTAVQVGLYRIQLSVPSGLSAVPINPGATNPRVVFECDDAFLYGLVQITAVANAYSATANVLTQINSTSATEYWSEGAWSNYRGFPQAAASYQQRIIYGSSGFEPQRIWGTVTNDIENFALGDQTDATDAFAFDLNAPGRGPIVWLIAQSDLFCGFSGAEWIINSGTVSGTGASTGSAITPSNINAVEQGTFGSAPQVQPAIVGNAVFFAQRQADAIRQMLFSVYTAKYMSQDLSTLADHLFASGIVQIAYQPRWRHQGIIWCVTNQGTLCGLTYDLEQEVFGWFQAQTGYGQTSLALPPGLIDNGFESVSVIDGKGTADDEVWLVANRSIGGVNTRSIERMNPVNWEEIFTGAPNPPAPVLADAFYVDSGVTVLNPGTTYITGLGHLPGRYVYGLADGYPFGPILCNGGTAQLPPSIPTTVGTVQIGLPIYYSGQPMRFDSDARMGNTQGLVKQVSDVFIRVWNSMGGSISNGTTPLPQWVSGTNYAVGAQVISPATQLAYQCITAYSGTVDPSASASWVNFPKPVSNAPVPIPYTPSTGNPFASPVLVTEPTDIRITPMLNISPDTDPTVIVMGNDALPLTVLGIFLKYEVTATP